MFHFLEQGPTFAVCSTSGAPRTSSCQLLGPDGESTRCSCGESFLHSFLGSDSGSESALCVTLTPCVNHSLATPPPHLPIHSLPGVVRPFVPLEDSGVQNEVGTAGDLIK